MMRMLLAAAMLIGGAAAARPAAADFVLADEVGFACLDRDHLAAAYAAYEAKSLAGLPKDCMPTNAGREVTLGTRVGDDTLVKFCAADGCSEAWVRVTMLRRRAAPPPSQAQDGNTQAGVDLDSAAAADGYRIVAGKDFKLDGKELAGTNAKVSVTGIYTTAFDNHFLMVGGSFLDPVKIGLLIDDAPRETRARFIECQSKLIYYGFYGCRITLVGRAAMCTRTDLAGTTRDEPCLAVEGSYTKP